MAELLKTAEETEERETCRVCPYCGQARFSNPDDDPRDYCDCDEAILWRSYVDALDDFCGEECYKESAEFKAMESEVMGALRVLADFRVRGYFRSLTLELPDYSTLSLGRKVKRSVKVTAEKSVAE